MHVLAAPYPNRLEMYVDDRIVHIPERGVLTAKHCILKNSGSYYIVDKLI